MKNHDAKTVEFTEDHNFGGVLYREGDRLSGSVKQLGPLIDGGVVRAITKKAKPIDPES